MEAEYTETQETNQSSVPSIESVVLRGVVRVIPRERNNCQCRISRSSGWFAKRLRSFLSEKFHCGERRSTTRSIDFVRLKSFQRAKFIVEKVSIQWRNILKNSNRSFSRLTLWGRWYKGCTTYCCLAKNTS